MTPEQRIAVAAEHRLGRTPVLLCGSRALGIQHQDSDFDVVVVLPALRIPLALRRLRVLAQSLTAELGVPVTINPLPRRALRRPQSLFAWKLRREARVISAPGQFELDAPGDVRLTPLSTYSYLLTAAFHLLEAAEPASTEGRLDPDARHRVVKALLHVAQIRLLRQGRYEPRLEDALRELAAEDLTAAAGGVGRDDGWVRTRDLVLDEVASLSTKLNGVAVANLRYVVLAALRGRLRVDALFSTQRIDERLGRAALELLRSVHPSGRIDLGGVARARALLPGSVARRTEATSSSLRQTLLREWPDAHPLSAL